MLVALLKKEEEFESAKAGLEERQAAIIIQTYLKDPNLVLNDAPVSKSKARVLQNAMETIKNQVFHTAHPNVSVLTWRKIFSKYRVPSELHEGILHQADEMKI